METIDEPYKATKMWTELVQLFGTGIPRKRHWKHIKFYDNSFTGAEAIQWFHKTLQNHARFGSGVTKEQTVQLLCKFLKAGILRDAASCHKKDVIKQGHVYLLNKEVFDSSAVTNFTEVNGLLSGCREKVPKSFESFDEKLNEPAWRNKAETHLSSEKNFSQSFPPFNENHYKPYSEGDQMYNLQSHMPQSLSVTSINSRKALIDILNTDSSSHDSRGYIGQKYVGFNYKDTFPTTNNSSRSKKTSAAKTGLHSEMYRSHFEPMFDFSINNVSKEILPYGSSSDATRNANCITANDFLHSAVMIRLRKLFDGTLDINDLLLVPTVWIAINLRKNVICSSYMETVFPQTIFSILKKNVDDITEFPKEDVNLIVNFLLVEAAPLLSSEVFECIMKMFMFICSDANQEDTAVLNSVASDSFENLILEMTHSSSHFCDEKEETVPTFLSSVLPPNYCFETAFTSDNPVTRIIPQSSVDSVHLFKKQSKFQAKRNTLQSDNNSCSYSSNRKSKGNCSRPLSSNIFDTAKLSTSGGYDNLALSCSLEDLNDEELNRHEMDYEAALKTLKTLTDFLQNDTQSDPSFKDQYYSNSKFCDTDNNLSESESSFHTACSTPNNSKCIIDSTDFILDCEEKDDMVCNALQLIMLFLQPVSFVSAYTLLSYMAHIHQYQIFKYQVVNLLSKILLSGHTGKEYQVPIVNKISQFMLCHYKRIFSPPSDLELDFKHEVSKLEDKKYSVCQQVSSKEFEEHKQSTSQKDIPELLDAILQDKNISSKERKRWLKMFSVSYPSIYQSRFPSGSVSSKGDSKASYKFDLGSNPSSLRV